MLPLLEFFYNDIWSTVINKLQIYFDKLLTLTYTVINTLL
jgi:hypothetical protein